MEASSPSSGRAKEGESEEMDDIDQAILAALQTKHRDTVLDFEARVLDFLETSEEALIFPLFLSGYQRLLAHRTAQHHGLQTKTIADESEDHGKIKATRSEEGCTVRKEKLADVPVPATPTEDQREPPKALKKKAPPQRPQPRDNYGPEGSRGTLERQFKPYHERNQNYNRERERLFESVPDGQHPESVRSALSLRNGSDGGGSNELGKATFRNRNQELLDPDFQRYRFAPNYGGMEARFRPMHGEEMDHMAQMMQGLSFGHGPENAGLAYSGQHPNAVPMNTPYGPMAIPAMGYNYQGPMMQQIPQGMGMYSAAGVPYAYPQIPQQQYAHATYSPQQYVQPYPYPMSVRPTNGIMPPYGGQQMGQNVMPYFQPQFVHQGYQVPGPVSQGRPGFGVPPRQQNSYQARQMPSNGSGGYTRKPNSATNRPIRPDASVTPKGVAEASPAAVSAPPASTSAGQLPAPAPGTGSPTITSPPPATEPEQVAKDGDKEQA